MKKRLITTTDVKHQMVELFSATLPELKNLNSSPIIGCEYGFSVTGYKVARQPYCIWILPNDSAIIYKIQTNRYTYTPKLTNDVTVALDGTLIDNDGYKIEIKKLNYINEGNQIITDVVVVIEEKEDTPINLGKNYEIIEL